MEEVDAVLPFAHHDKGKRLNPEADCLLAVLGARVLIEPFRYFESLLPGEGRALIPVPPYAHPRGHSTEFTPNLVIKHEGAKQPAQEIAAANAFSRGLFDKATVQEPRVRGRISAGRKYKPPIQLALEVGDWLNQGTAAQPWLQLGDVRTVDVEGR